MPTIILASTSPYRKALLQRLGLTFSQQDPNTDETPQPGESHTELALRLAVAKAQSINATDSLVIGSDQVAVLKGEQLNKPGAVARARAQLQAASGNTVIFYTSLALLNTRTKTYQADVAIYKATLRRLSDAEIDRYITVEEPFDCAGSFKWEKLGISLMSKLEGADPTALEGLPLISLSNMLRAEGVLVP